MLGTDFGGCSVMEGDFDDSVSCVEGKNLSLFYINSHFCGCSAMEGDFDDSVSCVEGKPFIILYKFTTTFAKLYSGLI